MAENWQLIRAAEILPAVLSAAMMMDEDADVGVAVGG